MSLTNFSYFCSIKWSYDQENLFLFTVLVAFPSLFFLFVGCRKSIEDRAVEEAALILRDFVLLLIEKILVWIV